MGEKNENTGFGRGYTGPDRGRMEAVGLLGGGLAHDMNNLLGVIEGFASLALHSLKDGAPASADIKEIRRAVSRAAALARQMMVLSGRRAMRKERCRSGEMVDQVANAARGLTGAGIAIELALQSGLPDIIADPAALEPALINLLLNARDAMPGGGVISVSACAQRLERFAVKSPVPAEAGAYFVKISVSDTGSGMAPEVLAHAFEPYFTTKERGRGLGLSTVYGVAKQHNGWVEAQSAPGNGSEFVVFLPACPAGHNEMQLSTPKPR